MGLLSSAMDSMASSPISQAVTQELEDAANLLDALLKATEEQGGDLTNCKDFLRKSTLRSLLNSVVKIEDHSIEGDSNQQGLFLGSYIKMHLRNLKVSIIPDQIRDALLLSDSTIGMV